MPDWSRNEYKILRLSPESNIRGAEDDYFSDMESMEKICFILLRQKRQQNIYQRNLKASI